ncbi:MAG: hypothetical protein NZ581_02950 [Candidatus Caldarchaeum sp.]|nr:hypothetical protein [Candidatus Caldarchaeum sp.]MDW8435142.1 hypothetical protein [Candidatus Caldarchaeum sp.]
MMRLKILLVAVLLVLPLASSEVVTFRRSYGGAGDEFTFDIFVDSNAIYTVGSTNSFGSNPPNAFLTIFNSDNSHRCSVAFDVGAADQASALTVHAGRIYVLGTTNFGANPPNHFIAIFDTTCNLQTFKLFDIGLDDLRDIAVEPAASPSFYIVGSQTTNGVYLAKLDSSLNVVWARAFKVRGGNDVANSVFFSGGRVYVAGTSDDGSSLNMFLSVFDTAGAHVATRELAGSTNEEAHGVLFSAGNIYLTGYVDYPGRMNEMVLAKLDTSYNIQWVKAFGTASGNEVSRELTIAGGLLYMTGFTNAFGTLDALLTAFAPDGSFSHSFFISGGGGNDVGYSVAGLGACVYPAGQHVNWPLFYAIFDGQVNTVVLTVNTITPSITNISPSSPSASPSISSYTPTIDSSAATNSFYSKFCPDILVSTTTSTTTTTFATTTTSTSTVTSTTTAYAIATTTFTQTSSVILVVSQTTYTTIPVTTTQTIPTTTTQTATTTVSSTTTSTVTNTVTSTQSTTQTITAITTVAFAEPVSTYILPMILLMIAVLMATAIIVSRRRSTPTEPGSRIPSSF